MTFPPELLQQCWFLAGPTAVGKTSTSLLLAETLNAEIISLDSMAVFKRMDIGTAKPSPQECGDIPHHLIDVVQPWDDFSTADYLTHAHAAVRNILDRKRVPLFVGGTGLYLRALLRGVFEGPPADWTFRNNLEEQAAQHSPEWLFEELTAIDPATAKKLHPNDTRRLVRALEIHHITGQRVSELHQESALPVDQQPQHVYWLHPPREWLYERINQRVDMMLEEGLIEEVDALQQLERPLSRTARQALGYRELLDWREGTLASVEEAVTLIKTRTRQFAKRQHTWFRNLEECQEIQITPDTTPVEIVERLSGNSDS